MIPKELRALASSRPLDQTNELAAWAGSVEWALRDSADKIDELHLLLKHLHTPEGNKIAIERATGGDATSTSKIIFPPSVHETVDLLLKRVHYLEEMTESLDSRVTYFEEKD